MKNHYVLIINRTARKNNIMRNRDRVRTKVAALSVAAVVVAAPFTIIIGKMRIKMILYWISFRSNSPSNSRLQSFKSSLKTCLVCMALVAVAQTLLKGILNRIYKTLRSLRLLKTHLTIAKIRMKTPITEKVFNMRRKTRNLRDSRRNHSPYNKKNTKDQ